MADEFNIDLTEDEQQGSSASGSSPVNNSSTPDPPISSDDDGKATDDGSVDDNATRTPDGYIEDDSQTAGTPGQEPDNTPPPETPPPAETEYEYTKVTTEECISDFSAASLQRYRDSGAKAIAVYDDGTEAEVDWSTVTDPAGNTLHGEVVDLSGVADSKIAAVRAEIDEFKEEAEATYATNTYVDEQTQAVTNSVSANYVSKTDAATTYATKSEVQQTSDSWTTMVETNYATKSELNSISVGGENLISFYSGRFGYLTASGTWGAPSIPNNEGTSGFIQVDPTANYIFQMWNTDALDNMWYRIVFYDSEKVKVGNAISATPGRIPHFERDIEFPEGSSYMRVSVRLFNGVRAKLEKGTVPTEWSPNADDARQQQTVGNVHPFFSTDKWADWFEGTAPASVTLLDDGWARIRIDNSESSSAASWVNLVAKISDLVSNVEGDMHIYTVLVETRNNQCAGTVEFDVSIANDGNQLNSNTAYTNLADSELWGNGSMHLVVGGKYENVSAINRLMTSAFRATANSLMDVEVRLSAYPGWYTGPYIPYKGTLGGISKTYATKSELSVTDTSIRQSVSENLAEAKTYADGKVAQEVIDRNAAIETASNAITLGVSQTYATKSDVEETYATKESVDSISVGGRNLLRGTRDFKATSWVLARSSVPDDGLLLMKPTTSMALACTRTDYLPYDEYNDGVYTLSCDAKIADVESSYETNPDLVMTLGFKAASRVGSVFGAAYDIMSPVKVDVSELTDGWVRYSAVFEVPEQMTYGKPEVLASGSILAVQFRVNASRKPAYVRLPKLERGNKATDWTPAPEDMAENSAVETTYATKSELTVATNAITSEVTAVKTTAVTNVVVEYALGNSSSTAPTSGWSSASPSWTTGKYVWQRTATTVDGTTTYSNVACIQGAKGEDGAPGANGAPGADGTSVTVSSVKYAASTSGTTAPSSGWSTTIPTVADGSYLWTQVEYSDGAKAYSAAKQGEDGSDGAPGKGVSSAATTYQASGSGTTVPSGSWSSSIPSTSESKPYLWARTVTTYTDSTTSTAYSVSRQGADGASGKGISSITEYYAVSNSTTAPADSSFSTGAKAPTATNRYLWNYEKVAYTDGTTVNLDKHIAAVYGQTGDAGKGISSITEYYAATSSTTAPADSSFSTSVASTTAANRYLWNYELVTYSDGTTERTAKRIIGTYGENGKMLYGTCSTDSGRSPKVVVCPDAVSLYAGLSILVSFENGSTSSATYMDVNYKGSKPIYVNGAAASSSNKFMWGAGAAIEFVYDGEYWVPVGHPASYHGTCDTAADTATKLATIPQVVVCKGTVVNIDMANGNSAANATLDVTSASAQAIYANGSRLTATSEYNWLAGATVQFTFDGQYWRMGEQMGKKVEAISTQVTQTAQDVTTAITNINGVKTMIREYENGVLVCKTGSTVGALVNANGSFDVVGVTWSGDTATAGTVLSTSGSDGFRYGYENESHLVGDYHSLQLIYGNQTYFHVSDLRDRTGYASYTNYFRGNGTATSFTLSPGSQGHTEVLQVVVDGSTVTGYTAALTTTGYKVTLQSAPADGADVYITFKTTDPTAKAYTLGVRNGSADIGAMSLAEGYLTRAAGYCSHAEGNMSSAYGFSAHAENMGIADGAYSHAEGAGRTRGSNSHAEGYSDANGAYSHAQNYGTVAESSYQTALGKYNKADKNGTYAVIVGNGSVSARSNALTVDWSGNVAAGSFTNSATGQGLWGVDSTGATYPLVWDSGTDLWLGAGSNIARHHRGKTYISAGHTGSAGNDSIYVCVPNAANNGGTNHKVFHEGYLDVSDATAGALPIAYGGTGSSGWLAQTLELSSACTAYSTGQAPLLAKWGCLVQFFGAVKPTSEVAAGGTLNICTLPSGCRPPQPINLLCQGSGNSVWLLTIEASGAVKASRFRNGASANAAMTTSTWLPFNATFLVG